MCYFSRQTIVVDKYLPNNNLNPLISAKREEGLGWWSSAKGGRIASCWGQSQSFDQNKIEIGTKPRWIGRFGGKREKGT